MPYNGIPESLWPKMERCVADVMATGKDKSSAIAICHKSVMGEGGLHFVQSSMGFEWDTGLKAQSDGPMGRMLYFTDAVVAHVTVNGNGDALVSEGLHELAASLPLMPLNIAHDGKQNMGVITAARVRDWRTPDGRILKESELTVDGVVWAMNYTDEAQEIIKGVRKLSIEADAKTAVIHIDTRAKSETRYLFGLVARGVATTTNPADKGAVFDTENGLLMLAQVGETVAYDAAMEAYIEQQRARSAEVTEADLEAERARTDAWYMVRDAFNRNLNRGGDYEVVDIEAEHVVLARGGKTFLAKYKVENGNVVFSDGMTEVRRMWLPVSSLPIPFKQEGDVNELEKLQAQIADLQQQLDAAKKSATEAEQAKTAMQAELDTLRPLTEQVSTLSAEVAQLKEKATADAQQAVKTATLTAERAMELAPLLGNKRVAELLPDLGSMDEKAFTLIAEVRKVSGARGPLHVGDVPPANGNGELTYANLFEEAK